MTQEPTLETIRLFGMRVLAGAALALGLCTLGGALLEGKASEYVAALLALALTAYPCMLALNRRTDAAARLATSITVTGQPALLLYVFAGAPWQVDLHMLFFAVLAMTAILCDWRAIVAASAVVAVHHLVFGMAVPDWVFLGGGSLGRILLHAVVLIAEAATLTWLTSQLVLLIEAIDRKESERRAIAEQAEAERNRQAAELQLAVGELGEQLGALAGGDLSHDIEVEFPSAYARLRSDYNAAVRGLRELVGSVSLSATELRSGAGQIAEASENLARRTESNAASLEKTANAVAQMDGQLRETAGAAGRTVARADQAIAVIGSGRGIAEEAVSAMGRVSDSAKGIDDVIEGLDKIAFQTRVLAMNAAVEAGRAGEAGRGFAVVADLVSALAMRAEEEAKRAREQLTHTQGDIVSAVDAVRRVDDALSAIASDVGSVHTLLGAMANDNASQSAAVSQIASEIAAMDQSTQQNAAMVEETSAAARTLSGEITELSDKAARFTVSSGTAPGVAKPRSFAPAASRSKATSNGEWAAF